LEGITAQQLARLQPLSIDGLIVYDIQDEAARTLEPRPFPFLPTLDPDAYAHEHLASLKVQKIVYRCVTRDTPESFIDWLGQQSAATAPRASVLVGAPSQRSEGVLSLSRAYALARDMRLVSSLEESQSPSVMRVVPKSTSGCSRKQRMAVLSSLLRQSTM
jgi:hypothetical protein